jgi:predicted aspartyl protease
LRSRECLLCWSWLILVLCAGTPAARAQEPSRADPPSKQLFEPLSPATLDDGLIIQGDPITARELQSRMTVPVVVNGKGPFRFIVDSGADRTVVGRSLAASLSLPSAGSAVLNSMTGSSRVELAAIGRLDLGGTNVRNIKAPLLDERHLGAQGILGIDALVDQRVLLDFDRNQVVVQDARRRAAAPLPGEIVVTARRRRGQLILTEGEIAGRQVDAVIDTGAQVSVGNMALRRKLFGNRPVDSTKLATLTSVTGETLKAEVIVARRLSFGKLAMNDVPLVFVDAPPFALFGLSDRPALLLGADILQAFRRVSLDFRRKRVRFELR